jgi:membrane-bound serine protease (ClpP class)
MITIIWEVWLIKNRDTGELRIVRARDWRHRVAKVPPSTQPGVVAIKPPQDAPWAWVKTIADSHELVTLTDEDALRYGFVEHRFETIEDLKKHYNVTGEVTILGDTTSEKFVAVLNSQVVMTLLTMGLIFFAYTEMNTPGFGVAGAIALACLAVLVGARFLVGLANAIEIAALIIGLVLIGLEIFVTPGFGVLGISGIVIVLASLAAMAVANPLPKWPVPQTNLDWSILEEGLAAMLIGAILGTIGAVIAARYLPKLSAVKPMFLAPAAPTAEPALSQASPLRRIEPGDTGVVEAVCRPAGKVRFGDDLLDVTSEGTIISPGTTVRVLHRKGNMIVVEEA